MLKFDPETHIYTYNDVVVPSVTQVLKEAGIVDYDGIDPDVMERARIRGQDVHELCQWDDEGTLDENGADDEYRGYLEAWRKFKKETGFVCEKIEYPVYNSIYAYAGTLDRLGSIGEELWLLDIKTGQMQAWTALQTMAYLMALEYDAVVKKSNLGRKRGGVELRKDGTYRFEKFTQYKDRDVFLSALAVANWKRNNGK